VSFEIETKPESGRKKELTPKIAPDGAHQTAHLGRIDRVPRGGDAGRRFSIQRAVSARDFPPGHRKYNACNKTLREFRPVAMLLAMKWLFCLLLIGAGLFSYNQSQTIDTLTANLKQSEEELASLKRQVQASPPAAPRVSSSGASQAALPAYPPVATPPPWMNTHSDLDKTPVPHRR